MPPHDRYPPALKFDAAAVDQLAALMEAWRDHPVLAGADHAAAGWVLGILRTYAELPPIASAAQCRAYRRRLAKIQAAKLGRHAPKRAFDAFVRTPDGARWLALNARIKKWDEQRAARAKRLRRRIEDFVIAAVATPIALLIHLAAKLRRALKGN